MVKFESSVVVRRKLQVKFGRNTPTEAYIKRTFDRFCATGTVEGQEYPDRPSKITEQKINEIFKTNHNQVFVLLQQLAPFHQQQHVE